MAKMLDVPLCSQSSGIKFVVNALYLGDLSIAGCNTMGNRLTVAISKETTVRRLRAEKTLYSVERAVHV